MARQLKTAASNPPLRGAAWALVGLTVVLIAGCHDIFFVRTHSDDFIFLDAVRRFPVHEVLLGQHGIYPWYRPLSRELLFYLVMALGSSGPAAAQVLSILTAMITTWGVYAIGRRYYSHTPAVLAAVLFATCSLTKFLAAWASGYQDTLATCLIVCSVATELYGRRRTSLLLAALACLAKETGFLAFPILLVTQMWGRNQFMTPYVRQLLLAAALPLAAHMLARMTWHTTSGTIPVHVSVKQLFSSLTMALTSLLPAHVPPLNGWSLVWGIIAGAAALFLLRAAPAVVRASRGGTAFLPLAAVVSLLPLVAGHLNSWIRPNAYYAYPAIPWICLTLGLWMREVSRAGLTMGVAAIAFANVWCNAYERPALDRASAWVPELPSWREAVRISAVTERLSHDIRRELAARPESSIVLYYGLPYGAFFVQTTDGPATREVLRDPTVQASYIGQASDYVDPARLTILSFDSRRFHLVKVPRTRESIENGLLSALATNRPAAARAWYAYAPDSTREGNTISYLYASAALLNKEIRAYESLGPALDSHAGEPLRENGYDPAAWIVPRRFLPDAHLQLADSLVAWNQLLPAAAEYRIAMALGRDSSLEHLKLGLLLTELSLRDVGRPELEIAARLNSPAWAADVARRALADLAAIEE